MTKKASLPAKKKTVKTLHKKQTKCRPRTKKATPTTKNHTMPITHLYEAALDVQQCNARLLILRQQSPEISMINPQPNRLLSHESIKPPLSTVAFLPDIVGGDGLANAGSNHFTTDNTCSPLLPTMDVIPDILALETGCVGSKHVDDQPYQIIRKNSALFDECTTTPSMSQDEFSRYLDSLDQWPMVWLPISPHYSFFVI